MAYLHKRLTSLSPGLYQRPAPSGGAEPIDATVYAATGFAAGVRYDGPATDDLPSSHSLTIAALVSPLRVPDSVGAQLGRGSGTGAYRFLVASTAQRLQIGATISPTRTWLADDVDKWWLLVGTWDGSVQRLYMQGTEIGSGTANTDAAAADASRTAIGALAAGSTSQVADDFRIAAIAHSASIALSAPQVASLYASVEANGDILAAAFPSVEHICSIKQGGASSVDDMQADQVGTADFTTVGALSLYVDAAPVWGTV